MDHVPGSDEPMGLESMFAYQLVVLGLDMMESVPDEEIEAIMRSASPELRNVLLDLAAARFASIGARVQAEMGEAR